MAPKENKKMIVPNHGGSKYIFQIMVLAAQDKGMVSRKFTIRYCHILIQL